MPKLHIPSFTLLPVDGMDIPCYPSQLPPLLLTLLSRQRSGGSALLNMKHHPVGEITSHQKIQDTYRKCLRGTAKLLRALRTLLK